MTNRQIENIRRKASFVNNIDKLSYGRKTSYKKILEDGTEKVVATVRCTTVGSRPRLFTVVSSQIPAGTSYTYQGVLRNILDGSTIC